MNSKSTVTATNSTRPFVCEFCDRPFVNKSGLVHHQKTTQYCRRVRDRDAEEIPCETCNSNKDLLARVRNQEKQIGDLKLELARRDREISRLRDEKSTSCSCSCSCCSLDENDDHAPPEKFQAEFLINEVEILQEKNESLEAENSQYWDMIVSERAKVTKYRSRIADLEDTVKSHDAIVESLKTKANQYRIDSVALDSQIGVLNAGIYLITQNAKNEKNFHELAIRDLEDKHARETAEADDRNKCIINELQEKLAITDKANQELTFANTELRVSLEYMTSERDNAVKVRHIKQEYYQSMKPVNLDEENISYQVFNFRKKDRVDCPKGVAHALVKYLLTDDDDNLVYMCTDVDNRKFNYKDKTGVIRGDFEAKMLLEKVRPWIDNYTRRFYKQTMSDSDEEELVKQLAIMTRETDIIERLALVQ